MTKGQGVGPLYFIVGHGNRGQTHAPRNPGFPRGTLIDESDRARLGKLSWSIDGAGYVQRHIMLDGRPSKIRLHREIMNAPRGTVVDHVNGNKKDNRRQNLRVVDLVINGQNKALHSNNSSGVHGVSFRKSVGKWYAYAKIRGVMKSLGFYDSFEDAKRVATEFREKNYEGYIERDPGAHK